MRQLSLNIGISLVWAFLHTSFTVKHLVVGFILGAILIWILSPFLSNHNFYLIRILRIIKLMVIFLIELVKACFHVLYHIFQIELKIKPGIIRMEIDLDTPGEITLLANLITLTPGTLTVEVAKDNSALYIHTLVIDDAKSICDGIHNSFEKNIKKVRE